MIGKLTHPVRDPRTGIVHMTGEALEIVREKVLELGTHRVLISIRWATGTATMLLPDDVEVIHP